MEPVEFLFLGPDLVTSRLNLKRYPLSYRVFLINCNEKLSFKIILIHRDLVLPPIIFAYKTFLNCAESLPMDKSWIQISYRACPEYFNGVEQFLKFAFRRNIDSDNKIRCPCENCNNLIRKTKDEVRADLIIHGMVKSYTTWASHGETMVESSTEDDSDEEDYDDMHGLIMDTHGHRLTTTNGDEESDGNAPEKPNEKAETFYGLLKDAEKKLYPGCDKYSRLSAVIKLLHLKCLNGWSNKSVTSLFQLLKDMLPEGDSLPNSYYEAKKVMKDLGLNYVKIDACENDCVLYWKEHAGATQCPVCGLSRWKTDVGDKSRKKIPWKILRYFPLKPRLQRLFMSKNIAEAMRWHHDIRADDGVLKHPADSEAWKEFNRIHESFAADPRNVRLGLASDGFNPFGHMSISHSTWPVVLVPYNLPPWMCMKQPYIFMSLLIPGPKSPGNDIDVYMRPLIDELNELWETGVNTYDSSKQQNFQMKAAIMWTISDFPAYANLSGWSTKGFKACPCCNAQTKSKRLKFSKKTCYMGHRRFLPHNHKWRNKKKQFDNKVENDAAPRCLSGDDVLDQLRRCRQVTFGKAVSNEKLQGFGKTHNWTKHSIFFQLPYWRTLKLRHNLDVMHIEKNVCEAVVNTLMNVDGKTADSVKSRLDLKQMKIRKSLQLYKKNDKTVMPQSCYVLTRDERKTLCKWLKDLKVPDGYSANLSRCVNIKEGKIIGMKSHDCHIFLERLLPLAIRDLLPRNVCDASIEVSTFFKDLCSKELRVDDLERLERQIALTLCKLERIFPPSFFNIMEHLPIHLPSEAKIGGPVQYRWMYPIERYLRTVKSYVRNKAHPEGSIAEGYIAEECLTFCSMYLNGVETRFNREERNYDGGVVNTEGKLSVFSQSGRAFGKSTTCTLSNDEHTAARLYVLENCKEVIPFADEHKKQLKRAHVRNVDEVHIREFVDWFEQHVTQLYNEGNGEVDQQILSLARGPERRVTSSSGYNINGFKFHTNQREMGKKTQNSGVVVKGESQKGDVDYYGQLTDVIELHYTAGNSVVLFKCNWWDVTHQGSGFKIDRYGFTSVNTSRKLNTNQPFVLACQANQVFYAKGIKDPHWQVVIKTKPRHAYDVPSDQVTNDAYQEDEPGRPLAYEGNEDERVVWNRDDGLEEVIDNVELPDEASHVASDANIDNDDCSDDYDSDDMLVDN